MGKRRNCTLINSIEFAKSRHLLAFFGYFFKNYPIFFSRIFVMRNKGRHLCFGRDRNLAAVSRSRVESEIALWGWHICVSISPRNLFLTSWVLKSTMGLEMHQNSMNHEVVFMLHSYDEIMKKVICIGLWKYLTPS